MRTFAVLVVSVLLFGGFGPAAPIPKDTDVGKECLVNGGFEDGPEVEKYLPLDAGDKRLTGWVVTRGQIDYIEAGQWQHDDGKRSLDLHGSPGIGGVKQAFKTKKGGTYKVTFLLAVNPGSDPIRKSVWAEAAGAKKKFTFDGTGATHEKMGWKTQEWEFVATGDETTLEIFSAETVDPFGGPALDAVSVKRTK